MATNTSESLKKAPIKDADFQRDLEAAMKHFAGEKKVKRKLNAALAQKVGSTLPVCINGVTLVVPDDRLVCVQVLVEVRPGEAKPAVTKRMREAIESLLVGLAEAI